MTCSFCGRPDYCGSTISPRMCEKHFGLVLIGLRLVRGGSVITVGTVRMELRKLDSAQRLAVGIEEGEIRELLIQLETCGYKFPIGNWKKCVNQMRIGDSEGSDENNSD
jgi:hypothetical protein